ncbi:hypothetical protein [Paenibacillus sp.]|nr:hypothetical protein [Paenibacillus sp.]
MDQKIGLNKQGQLRSSSELPRFLVYFILAMLIRVLNALNAFA